jgi:hypothetical protein
VKQTIMACLVVLTALPNVAEARVVVGHGAGSCGRWTEDQRDEYFALLDEAWVAGYLSSYNRRADAEINLPDPGGIRGWITQYCQNHPLDGIYTAAEELVDELNRRASQ